MSSPSRDPDEQARRAPRRHVARYLVDKISVFLTRIAFRGSGRYWDLRYRLKGSSGAGSYGTQARFKADFINRFMADNHIESVVDFGCGDGAQLSLLNPVPYLGVDVSPTAIELCRARFAGDRTKRFVALSELDGEQADLALSLDVVFHLVEDDVFEAYMDRLFAAGRRYVLVFATNHDQKYSPHVRHRELAGFCRRRYPGFGLITESETAPGADSSSARFLVFEKL